jgi:hypothetical protein
MVQTPKSEVTNVPCEEWSRILSRYCSAVSIYSSAARVMSSATRVMRAGGTVESDKAGEQSEEARKVSEGFRAALLEHGHRHGCQIAREPVQEIQCASF